MERNSNKKIEKATEIIWKIWWFCVYFLIIPSLSLVVTYFILSNFLEDFYYILSFSFVSFITSQFVFFKLYDKYRKNPFFGNEKKNLIIKISVIFLIYIVYFVSSIFFTLLNPLDLKFQLIPLIYICFAIPVVFFYLKYTPILFYSSEKDTFLDIYPQLSIKDTYKYLFIINCFSNIIVFIFTANVIYLTIGLVLFFSCFFYIITVFYTKKERKLFAEYTQIEDNQLNLKQIILKFNKKTFISLESYIFSIIILLPSLNIYLISLKGFNNYLEIVSYVSIILAIFFLYLKARIISYLSYEMKLDSLILNKTPNGENIDNKKILKYQNYNGIISFILLIIFILLFYLIDLNYLNFILIPIFYFIIYLEHNYNYIQKKNIEFLYFILTIISIGYISFIFFPIYWETITLIIQMAFFTILIYFALELFKRINLFTEEKVILWQNFLSVFIFFSISYSVYPLITTEDFLLILDSDILLISRILIFCIFFSFSLLISFYRLYSKFFKQKYISTFKLTIIFNFLLLDLLIVLLINTFIFNTLDLIHLISFILLSGIIFIFIYIVFIYINYEFKIITNVLIHIYYSIWLLFPLIYVYFIFISNIWLDSINLYKIDLLILIFIFSLLILSISIQFQLKFGLQLDKLKVKKYDKLTKINLFLISIEISIIIFLISYFQFLFNVFLSLFLSIATSAIIINILNWYYQSIIKKYTIFVNSISLFYLSSLIFYYSFLFTLDTTYIFILPLILFSISFNLCIIYLLKNNVKRNIFKKVLVGNNIILSISCIFIPSIISFELAKSYIYVDVIHIVNLSLYLLLTILFMFYLLGKKNNLEKTAKIILKLDIVIGIILAGTTIFYYLFILIPGHFIKIIFPIISTLFYLYGLFILSYKKGIFNKKFIQKLILCDIFLLCFLFISIPTFIWLELQAIDIYVNFIYIIILSLILLFLFLKLAEFSSEKIRLESIILSYIKLILIISWFLLSFSIGYILYENLVLIEWSDTYLRDFLIINCSILSLFMINSYNIKLIGNLGYYYNSIQKPESFQKVQKIGNSFKSIQSSGIIISSSFILASIFLLSNIVPIPVVELEILNFCLLFMLFLNIFHPLIIIFNQGYTKKKIFNILSKKISPLLYLIITNIIFTELYWFIYISDLMTNILFIFSLILINLCYYINNNEKNQKEYLKKFYILVIKTLLISFSILFLNADYSILVLFILYTIISLERKENLIIRFLIYVILSFVGFIKILNFFEATSLLEVVMGYPICIILIIFLMNFSLVLIFSVGINYKKINLIEKYLFYSLISSILFIFIFNFTRILLIYNITISILVFLFIVTFDYYLREDKRYKWFIKPCIILLLFNISSWISYSFLFTDSSYQLYNIILTFALTSIFTSFGVIFLFNKLSKSLRKLIFYISLTTITLFIPGFIYTLLISYFGFYFGDPILIIIILDAIIFLFFISVGIYKWKISWAIWRVGWRILLFVPIINFYIIYNNVLGIDIFTQALDFFNLFDINGSIIITFIICSLFYLPILFSKIKKYFTEILLIVWGESLALTFWISQNLFIDNMLLSNLFFGLSSFFLLTPIFWRLKLWRILSFIWLILIVLNVSFLIFFLASMNFTIELIISIDIIVCGIFLIVYSIFPNVRTYILILIISYSMIFIGLFLTIYFILSEIILNQVISFNLSAIIISGGLYTSRYLKKINQPLIRTFISLNFIVNSSSLIHFSLNLIPNMEVLSISLAMTFCFGFLFLFNYFYLIFRRIPIEILWLLFGISLSFSIFTILYLVIPYYLFLLLAISSSITILFIHKILYHSKYLLIYLNPIPLSFLILEILEIYDFVKFFNIFTIFIYLMSYLIILQVVFNIRDEFIKPFENNRKIKIINLLCFSLNNFYFSLLISVFCFNSLFYQIFGFIFVYSILNLFIFYYLRKNKEILNIKGINWILENIGGLFYILIPSSILSLIWNVFISTSFTLPYLTLLIMIIFNGILTLELILNIYFFKHFTGELNKKISILSLILLNNSIAILIFLLLLDFSSIAILTQIFIFLLISLGLNIFALMLSQRLMKNKINILFKFQTVLTYLTYFLIIGMMSSFISQTTINLIPELHINQINFYNLFIFWFSAILLFYSIILNIYQEKILNFIKSIVFLIFQISLTLNLINLVLIYGDLDLLSINLIIFLNVGLLFLSIYFINIFKIQQKLPIFYKKFLSFLGNVIYFYLNFLIFSFVISIFDLYISLSITLILYVILLLIDVYLLQIVGKKYGFLQLTILMLILSFSSFIALNDYSQFSLVHLKLYSLLFIIMQFITNYLYLNFRTAEHPQNKYISRDKLSKINIKYKQRKIIIGVCFYFFLLILFQELINFIEISIQIFVLSNIIFLICLLDKSILKFMEEVTKYIKIISWSSIMISSNFLIFISFPTHNLQLILIRIPIVFLLGGLELIYLFHLLTIWKVFKNNKNRIRSYIYTFLTFDIISFPLFYFSQDLILDLNLIILSLLIFIILLYFIDILQDHQSKLIYKLNRYMQFIFINLLCLDFFVLSEAFLSPNFFLFNNYFNINISLVILLFLYAIYFKVFTEKSKKFSFLIWLLIFTLFGTIIFQISFYYNYFPLISSLSFLIFSILLYPFIFLMEQIKNFFNKFIDNLKKIIILIINKILMFFKGIIHFLKRYWIYIWTFFSVSFGISIFIVLFIYVKLYWLYSVIISVGITISLIYYNISKQVSDMEPDKLLKYRIMYLSSAWISVLGIILYYFEFKFYLIAIFLSFTIFGAIFLPYIYYKEKKEEISIKWRFYSTIFFIIMLIITLALFYFQFLSEVI